MKRLIITLIILGLLGFGGYKAYFFISEKSQQKAPEVRTNIAKLRDLESIVSATGEVRPLLNSIVKSEISGRITKIHKKEGDSVQKGEILLELDRTSVETQVRQAERNFQADKLRLDKAERNYKRLDQLFKQEFIGEKEFLDAKTDFELAQLSLEIAQARLEDAQEDLAKTTIVAPHEGIITLLDIVDGQVISGATSVSNGTDLLTIAELKSLFMEANINEVDIERLRLGQAAQLRFDAIPNFEINGEISVISLSARKDGNIRVFPIEVLFEAGNSRVRPGISATIDIPIDSVKDAVSVSLSAVFNELEGGSYAYLKTTTGWEKRTVETGINNLQHVEIKSGLGVDDVVALSRPSEFREDG
ncbi:MAG: efflux RND transporter periplasmic adaptor subunit [Opitutaceae bacterium]